LLDLGAGSFCGIFDFGALVDFFLMASPASMA
jgi:hypothetical protein